MEKLPKDWKILWNIHEIFASRAVQVGKVDGHGAPSVLQNLFDASGVEHVRLAYSNNGGLLKTRVADHA